MQTKIVSTKSLREMPTEEQCFIRENWRSKNVSIARARVKLGVTTRLHHLVGVDEIYLILRGKGLVRIGKLKPTEVEAGDTVFIPAGVPQQITNITGSDLIFYSSALQNSSQSVIAQKKIRNRHRKGYVK